MVSKLLAHLRQQWIGVLALLLVLTSGTAYALEGSNTVFSDDIVNGEVRNGDLAADAIGSGKIIDRQVKNADLSIGASSSNTIADGGIQGIDVNNDSLSGTDIDESSLEVVNDTVFRTDQVVNQPNGQRRAIVTATGLPAGNYLVTFRLYFVSDDQRVECGVAHGSVNGSIPIVKALRTNTGGNPQTIESTGVMTISQGGQDQVLYCMGLQLDWSASNAEIHFIELGSIADGMEG